MNSQNKLIRFDNDADIAFKYVAIVLISDCYIDNDVLRNNVISYEKDHDFKMLGNLFILGVYFDMCFDICVV